MRIIARALIPFLTVVLVSSLLVITACTNSATNPVKIVVYTDFECSTCAKFHSEVENELRRMYVSTGQVEIEVRLLAIVGRASQRAAQAALCAADQGKFLEYVDALFNNRDEMDSYSTEKLLNLAETIGLNLETFKTSYESRVKLIDLEKNRDLAQADDIVVLPTVIIDGSKVQGIKSLDTYIQLIEQALSK